MARMKSRIIVPHGKLKQLSQDCGVCESTARLALKGASDTAKAELIRHRAIRYFGGVKMK